MRQYHEPRQDLDAGARHASSSLRASASVPRHAVPHRLLAPIRGADAGSGHGGTVPKEI